MVRWAVILLAWLVCGASIAQTVRVGSKKFTESVVLGEMLAQLAGSSGAEAVHRRELGGSRILFNAVEAGELDAYAEYTGTLMRELLAGEAIGSPEGLRLALAERGLGVSGPIGFNNTYAIAMLPERAEALGVRTIGDLGSHADLRLGFSNEFMDRGDGWPGLAGAYGLGGLNARGMDHDLAYRALAAGQLDVIDAYATDAKLAAYGLAVLEDDIGYFPRYDAVVLYRLDLAERAPAALAAMLRLEGAIDETAMRVLNERAQLDRVPEAIVASGFLGETLGVSTVAAVESRRARLWRTTREQLVLVGVALGAAVMVAIPIGVVAARVRLAAPVILGAVGLIQTVPALALLVVLIKPFGLTATTAIVALFLYGLLPIVRNTHAAIVAIPPDLRESAEAIGLTGFQRLRWVELPMAIGSILAGIKTSAVITIGTATLAALIGAGGYGQPILTGIRLDDFGLILEGALPAAAMALVAQFLFDGIERLLTRAPASR